MQMPRFRLSKHNGTFLDAGHYTFYKQIHMSRILSKL